MDKLREDFEEWYARKYPLKKPSVRKLRLWEAYRDSRASIVVVLPEQRDEDFDTDVAYNEGLHDAEESLRSIGLSIKG